MKTIELSLPTSIRDFEIDRKISKARDVFINTFSSFVSKTSLVASKAGQKIIDSSILLFSSLKDINFSKGESKSFSASKEQGGINRKLKPPRKIVKYALYILVLVVVAGVVGRMFRNRKTDDNRTQVIGAKATQGLDKIYTFPLYDDGGDKVSDVKYEIVKAEKQDEIIVKGQKASAIEGRTFLLISIKVTNDYDEAIEINTKDYIRLSISGNTDEWLAPDIHNDPVQIQAISTKPTRVGFPISDSDKDLVLRVGEIDGEKEDIELDL